MNKSIRFKWVLIERRVIFEKDLSQKEAGTELKWRV